MPVQPYSPENTAENKVLSFQLRNQGAKAADRRLAKAKTFPTKSSSAELSEWWMNLKEGKKKEKLAMVIMASEYEPRIKQLDKCLGNLAALKSEMKSQVADIDSLKTQLLEKDEENQWLRGTMADAKAGQHLLMEKIKTLKTQLWEKVEENKQLGGMLADAKARRRQIKAELNQEAEENNSFRMQLKSNNKMLKSLKQHIESDKQEIESLRFELAQTSQELLEQGDDRCSGQCLLSNINLLELLPDLQQNNSNHEFWKKIQEWLDIGMPASQIVSLVKAKCPPKAWTSLQEELNKNKSICSNTRISSSTDKESLFRLFRRSIAKALGPGTKLLQLYSARSQKDGESFEDYIKEKFRLYCSFGCDYESNDPDINDYLFLQSVLFSAAEDFQHMVITDYVDMMNQAAVIESSRLEAERRNECLNCRKKGHVKVRCRKPGGGAEAGPNECFRCGIRGHWARNCMM